jgi:ATP/maltotriose-dependent transcriptional regulator MalT
MTLVSAPAGYGKTSLLVDLADDTPFPVCWLSLDESDSDIHAFASDLITAISRRFSDFGGQALRALDASSDADDNPAPLGNAIVQDIVDHIPEFFLLILDDFHVADQAVSVGQLLGLLLQHADRNWHIIVSSRTVPGNLPIIYLMAYDLIAFVGQDDLAFNVDEVQQVLEKTHNLVLTPEQADELVIASEGWITGIVLATTTMWRGMRDVLNQARAQQGPIYAYLADQAFEEQPEALRKAMLTMSTLPEMSEELCRQAIGLGGAGGVLQELERRGLFLTTVVDEDGVRYYRYHHLFRGFLQARLRDQDLGRFRRLHQQAAEWYEAREEWERAVTHRRLAGDVYAMAHTMENGARSLYLFGRLKTLIAWYEDVPAPLRAEFPRLLLFTARAMVDLGRTDEALPLLRQAEATFDERAETEEKLYATLQRVIIWHTWGRYADALAAAQEVLKTTNLPAPTAEAQRLAGLACLNLGRSGDAINHLSQSLDLYRELGLLKEMAMTYLELSLALLRLGRLNEGWANQDKAVNLLRQLGPSKYLAIALNNIACERYYLESDYVQTLTLLREALDVARAAGSPRAQTLVLLSTADLYRDLGALQEARRLYTQAKEIAQQLGHADLVNFALLGDAQALLQIGDAVEALGVAAQAYDQAQRRGYAYQFGLSYLMLGMVRLDTGNHQAALTEIEHGRDELVKSGARRDLTRAYMLLARARRATGDIKGALEALGQALDVGIETRTFHYLVIEGRCIFDLLKQMLRQNPADRRPAQIMDRIRALPDTARKVVGSLTSTTLLQPALRFYGFGPGNAEKDGNSIIWHSAKARYLIFYLLSHPPRSRDQIFRIFWPDAERDAARSAFHWTKSQARRALNRSLIVYQDSLYRVVWDPDCWFDVTAFESLLEEQGEDRQARLEEAVSLYQGDFLEDYDAEWCLPIRERLRIRYRDALLELSECYAEQREFAAAVSTLSRAMAVDDLHEPVVRALMRLYALDGRPGLALDIFHQLTRRLQKMRAFPEQETQSLYRSIQTNLPHPSLNLNPT